MAVDVGLIHFIFSCCDESLSFLLAILRTCNMRMRLCSVYA